MKQNILLAIIAALFCFGASSCKQAPVDPVDPVDTTWHTTTHKLTGTSWVLQSMDVRGQIRHVAAEDFRLKFASPLRAEGHAACNGYGADYKANDQKISFSNIVSTMAYCGDSSLDKYYFEALQTAKTYSYERSSLVITSLSGVSLFFAPADVPNYDSSIAVKFADFPVTDFRIDPFVIHNIRKIDASHIAVMVSYSGGCREHDFQLYADNTIMPGNATDFVKMIIAHDAHGDMCNAYFTKELIFDIEPLLKRWSGHQYGNYRLALQFSQSPEHHVDFIR